MRTEYAKVTRSSEQTLDCVGLLTMRTYTNVEYINSSGVDSVPIVDEVVLIHEINNDEVVCVGRLAQFSSQLSAGELRVHPTKNTGVLFSDNGDGSLTIYKCSEVQSSGTPPNNTYTYKIGQKIEITTTGDIQLQQMESDGTTVKSEIVLQEDGEIHMNASLINLN